MSGDLHYNLYCKRDDLTGFAFGGNKVRKMEYLIADAIEKQVATIPVGIIRPVLWKT